jgi:hypothetical protein
MIKLNEDRQSVLLWNDEELDANTLISQNQLSDSVLIDFNYLDVKDISFVRYLYNDIKYQIQISLSNHGINNEMYYDEEFISHIDEGGMRPIIGILTKYFLLCIKHNVHANIIFNNIDQDSNFSHIIGAIIFECITLHIKKYVIIICNNQTWITLDQGNDDFKRITSRCRNCLIKV